MWFFNKKAAQSNIASNTESRSQMSLGGLSMLPFKSGAGFLDYQCKYGHTEIKPKQGLVALVLDPSKEYGVANAIKLESDGRQMAMLKVASDDGGFTVMAQTPTGKGDRLKPDDVVIWVPMNYSKQIVAKGIDDRFGWIGFIMAKVKPEISFTNPNFNVICTYD